MRDIFQLFCEDVNNERFPRKGETVLIGSPGVGKSLLFFLGALFMAQKSLQPRETQVIYCRLTKKNDERVSIFIMAPNEKTDGLHVVFTRNLPKAKLGNDGLMCLFDFLDPSYIVRNRCYVFIDGPRHDDRANTLDAGCDYLCTSGGHPSFKSEQIKNRMWVLDGWSEDEAIEGLRILGYQKSLVEEAYTLCGGKVREIIKVCEGEREELQLSLDGACDELNSSSITLAIQSTERNLADNIPDRLRTMFRNPTITNTKLMRVFQVVDSSYVLNRLCEKLDMEPFFKAYKLSQNVKVESAQGLYFEKIVHQWFLKDSKRADSNSPIQEVCFSTGKTDEGVCQLSKPNMYWVPSVSNFENIDSALVLNNTLFAFQVTIQHSHKFKQTTFQSSFVKPVKKAFQNQLGGKGITQVVLVFVVTVPENRFTVPESITKFKSITHQVITDNMDTVSYSMGELLEKLLKDSMHT
jgi:hypothetical protein